MPVRIFLIAIAVSACHASPTRAPRIDNQAPARPSSPPPPVSKSDEDHLLAFIDYAVQQLDAAPTCEDKAIVWNQLAQEAHALAPAHQRIAADPEREKAFVNRIPVGPYQGLIVEPMCKGFPKESFDAFAAALTEATGL